MRNCLCFSSLIVIPLFLIRILRRGYGWIFRGRLWAAVFGFRDLIERLFKIGGVFNNVSARRARGVLVHICIRHV